MRTHKKPKKKKVSLREKAVRLQMRERHRLIERAETMATDHRTISSPIDNALIG